jgi:predicted nucleic acid-binding protein
VTEGTLVYADTSAFLKLVVTEDHTDALREWATDNEVAFVSSDLLRTEALRAVRHQDAQVRTAVRDELAVVRCLRVSRAICDIAAELHPSVMRTLDAVHVATALSVAPDVDTLVTYDRRMAEASRAAGLTSLSPGES